MSTMDVMELMASWPMMTRTEHGALVHTHCLMPSGSTLNVFVQPSMDRWVVSDHGSAVREALASAASIENLIGGLAKQVSAKGLNFAEGKIYSPPVSAGEVPLAVVVVANMARDMAEWLIERGAPHLSKPSVADELRGLLRQRFSALMTNELNLAGASNTIRRFENVLILPSLKKLVLDPVAHQANSINARVIANLDVRQRNLPDLIQHIVFDDREEWGNEEIATLRVGADPIPLSQTEAVVRRLAA